MGGLSKGEDYAVGAALEAGALGDLVDPDLDASGVAEDLAAEAGAKGGLAGGCGVGAAEILEAVQVVDAATAGDAGEADVGDGDAADLEVIGAAAVAEGAVAPGVADADSGALGGDGDGCGHWAGGARVTALGDGGGG